MRNSFGDLNDNDLLATGQEASAAITAAAGGYGTSAAQDTALTSANTRFSAGITGSSATKTAAKAATQEKLGGREDLLAALSSIGATIYNDPAVTDTMLADAGFAIHDTTRTDHSPLQPVKLTTTPDEFGTVLFAWETNGNVYPTTYVIEGRASENDAWAQVTTTLRKRISISGFTPGASHMFRVKARRNESDSIYSNVSTIWTPEEVSLEVAA